MNLDPVHAAARAAYAAGASVVAVRDDGSKAPTGRWRDYITKRASPEQLKAWFPGAKGLGILACPASGGVEAWDFDDPEVWAQFVAAAHATGLGELIERIEHGYTETTPGDGLHWIVRQAEPEPRNGQVILAKRSDKALIELPLHTIVAPSHDGIHPSGEPYTLMTGGWDQLATYTRGERAALPKS